MRRAAPQRCCPAAAAACTPELTSNFLHSVCRSGSTWATSHSSTLLLHLTAPAPPVPPDPQIWQRLGFFKNLKAEARKARRPPPVVGVLGCMAERLKQRLLESDRLVDLVAGPDAYRWVEWGSSAAGLLVNGGLKQRLLDSDCLAG